MLIRVKFGIHKVKEFQEERESFLCHYLLQVWCPNTFSFGVNAILRFMYNTLQNEKSDQDFHFSRTFIHPTSSSGSWFKIRICCKKQVGVYISLFRQLPPLFSTVDVQARKCSKHQFLGSHWLPKRLVVPCSGENVNYYEKTKTIVALTMVLTLIYGHWQYRIPEKMSIITKGLIPKSC